MSALSRVLPLFIGLLVSAPLIAQTAPVAEPAVDAQLVPAATPPEANTDNATLPAAEKAEAKAAQQEKPDEHFAAMTAVADDIVGGELPGTGVAGRALNATDLAGGSGEMTYRVDFNIPAFRDLQPKLGLAYNSHVTGRQGSNSVVGSGWNLLGFSSIERVSARRGAPTYRSGQDIFALDGVELLKCNGANLQVTGVDAAAWAYASSHVKTNASPGCSAGGDFTTLNESYFRIKFDQATNTFVITQKNGVTFTYQSIAALISEVAAPSDPVAYAKIYERRKWVLTKVEDTQVDANAVIFKYKFDTTGRSYYHVGYPERPYRVEYAGYTVEFIYAIQPTPVASFTTGTPYNGEQYNLLEAVTVSQGATKIRAYDLTYETTSVTNTKLVSSVKEFGNNYVVGATGAVTGASLPAVQFSYNNGIADGYRLSARFYPELTGYVAPTLVHNGVSEATGAFGSDTSDTFHTSIQVVETNGDGIDEILALDLKPNASGNPFYRERSGHFTFDSNGNVTRNTAAYAIPTGRFTDGGSYWTFLGMNRWTPDQNRPMAIRGRFYNTDDKRYLEANPLTASWFNNLEVEAARAQDRVHFLTGNFDSDPELEVMIRDSIYDVNEFPATGAQRFTKKTPTVTSHSQCTGRTWVNARVVDANSDGIDDVYYKAKYDGKTDQYCIRLVNPNGYVDAPYSSERVISCCANVENELYWDFAFGDFNGDGVADSVRFGGDSNGLPTNLAVSFGNGDGSFAGRQEWFPAIDMWTNALSTGAFFSTSAIPTDLNGDGLDDLILWAGYDDGTYSWKTRKVSGPVRIFLSTGSSFVEQSMFSNPNTLIGGFATVGDFNGDGVKDLVYADSIDASKRPRIMFGNTPAGYRLTGVTRELGETLSVEYTPSTKFPDDQTPYVRQLVSKISADPGIGAVRNVSFTYSGGRYDYAERKMIGFREIRATLPRLANETQNLVQVTEYRTGHFSEAGLINRQYIQYGNTIYQETQNSWSIVNTGKGPFSNLKTRERSGVRYGSDLIFSTKDYTYNAYGDVLTEINWAFDGTQDNVSTAFHYVPNTSDYIVNKIAARAVLKGSTATIAPHANRMFVEYFGYDGLAWTQAPTRGNHTSQNLWSGDVTTDASRRVLTKTYDNFGNVLTEKNARNYTTTFTFGGPRSLFELTKTNAKSHAVTTQWNTACQSPSLVTDPNGLATSYTYDAHCRETLKRVAWGTASSQRQDYQTRYVGYGVPGSQYIEKFEKSSNAVAGSDIAYSRQYFDGRGKVFKETSPGINSDIANARVVLRRLDVRDKVEWESIPLTWAETTTNVAAVNRRTTFAYDPIGRVTRKTFADNARSEVSYSSYNGTIQGQTTLWPQVYDQGPQCFDNNAATVCEEAWRVMDSDQNLVLLRHADRALTDTDAGGSIWRNEFYEYDALGRMTKVVDPGGLVFTYAYDSYGNRITQNDPGLGRWTLTYYPDGTLQSQVDAKNTEIYFWYDELGRVERKRVNTRDTLGTVLTSENTYSVYDGEEGSPVAGFYYKGFLTRQYTVGANAHDVLNRYDMRGNIIYQTNIVNAKSYVWEAQYTVAGHLSRQTQYYVPGQTSRKWTPTITYDTAGRQIAFGSYITSTTYDIWGNMVERVYGNGAKTVNSYNALRGWVTGLRHYNATGGYIAHAIYTKSVSGRVLQANTADNQGDLAYTYDYMGRLLSATFTGTNTTIAGQVNQSFSYDRAGRMRSNSKVGTYAYSASLSVGGNGRSINGHAPNTITDPVTLTSQTLTYDYNGNMTRGLNNKVMTYDAQNRPASVTYAGNETRYVYGADGQRLKKIEKFGTAAQTVTLYLNGTEIRNFGQGASNEELLTYLADEVRVTDTAAQAGRVDYLHFDQLGSVIGTSKADGTSVERRTYFAFGLQSFQLISDATAKAETKAFLGERYDADAGLMYLNARYYDPELGIFIQPDWFEVTEKGVGTNRYAYAHNDPINKMDPNGNFFFALINIAAAVASVVSLIQTIMSLPQTIAALVAVIQAGDFATIGSWVIRYAIEEAISRLPLGRYIPRWVTDGIADGVTAALRKIGLSPEVIGRAVSDSYSRYCSGSSSFEGSTLVITEDGPARIDSMLLGKRALAKDAVTGKVDYRKITKQHVAEYVDRYEVTVRDIESGTEQTLTASWTHPFFARMPENTPIAVGAEGLVYQGAIEWAAWVDAKDLKPGYELLNPDDTWAEVVSVSKVDTPLTAYNLTVDEFSTFFVAANDDAEPVWVHNTSCSLSNRTYQTYTKTNPVTGEVYTGRTSGLGTPEQNLAARDVGHHMNSQGFGPAELDVSSSDPLAIRGREQLMIDANGGAQSFGGMSGNAINGISPRNPRRPIYMGAALDEFGPI